MSTDVKAPPPRRITAIDAYRGLVMFLMLAEVLHFQGVAKALTESKTWQLLAHHQEHVEWVGCSLHDLIQPSFSFLVGVALPFSIASRLARGQSRPGMAAHAAWRAFVLVALGIFLRSLGQHRTVYTFEDTLTQIGLGYFFLFLLGLRPARDQWIALAVILVGYWAAFALYPVPGSGFNYKTAGVPPDWPHNLKGFAAHWNKNTNLAWAFDRWFLNLFPRENVFTHNGGGYATLSAIPTLGTMVLGLLAGGVLRREVPARRKLAWLVVAGVVGLAAGTALGELGICPVVKRIWTPSWVLYSGGWCFLILAGFLATTDAIGLRGWTYPLRVVGANSIAAYVMNWLIKGFVVDRLTAHLGDRTFGAAGPAYESLLRGGATLLVLWLILFWMDRKRIYLRI
jgi:predicted acyltransferase